jgi:hypothetical protein
MSASAILILNVNGDLEINKPEARNVKAFNTLIRRDRGSIGDSEGKIKKRANAELLYIYLVYDPRSMFYNLPLKFREQKAIEYTGLPSDWKPDEAIDIAISTYLNEYAKLSPIANAYYAAERALFNTAEDVHDIQENIGYYKLLAKKVNKVLMEESSQGVKIGNTELITNLKEATAILSALTKLQSDSIKIINDLPKVEQTVKELLGKYAEEGGNVKSIVGGGELGNREE